MNIPMPQRNIMASRALDGKVSLVTGSTSGIGLGIARALAAAGSPIVLNGFGKPDEIAATPWQLADQFGVQVQYSPADVAKVDAIEQMIAGVLTSFGRLDVLVNNAGVQHVAPIAEFPVEKWQVILAINLSSAFHTTRCPRCGRTAGGASSISRPLTGSSPRRSNPPMWRPSTGSSG